MYSYSIISSQARTPSTRGISTILRSFRETQGRFIWPPTSAACQKESTTSKDLDRKNEIGPIYAPYKEENRSVTTTKQQKEKKIFRNEKEGPSSRQEELSETKRREDPPKTRPPRRTFRSEASGRPAEDENTERTLQKRRAKKTSRNRNCGTHTARRQLHASRRRQARTRRRQNPGSDSASNAEPGRKPPSRALTSS